ncbi:hypothetical protein IDH44_08220 [Paenibacillus sp. IB182496]|uniref:DUF3939 domain-containing protein n=1 Tax=Paenibacillus sabuli TaxID=2772509 RepID=A0A927GR31_9BACL|nr:hypothetical protein [Paenibacillus sabuli]MBD2845174.1 hypothetical protein [Paenibacillus sabuli]
MMGYANKKMAALLAMSAVAIMLLGGCLYPDEQRQANGVSVREAVRNMQMVVDQYQKDTGMLPIQNSTPQTPKYEKYVIDLGKLQRMQYISDLPAVSFEKGGSYYFLILDEETDPTVKLMDLVPYQKINDLQSKVDAYVAGSGELPAGEEAYPGFSWIDYERLGGKAPELRSPYSGLSLSAMLDVQGRVYIDYGVDLARAAERSGEEPSSQRDLRELLVEGADYVPVKAPVYRWVQGEPRAVAADGTDAAG